MRSGGGQETSKAVVRQRGNTFDADISVPVWTSQLFVSEWWKQAPLPVELSVVSASDEFRVTVQNQLETKLKEVMIAIDGRLYTVGDLDAGQKRLLSFGKYSGEGLDQFVQNHGNRFPQVVNQRHQAFGSDESWRISNVPRSAIAASFISRLQGNRSSQQNQYYYGYNYAVTPPGFDLSSLVERGDAVLLAWAPGFTMNKPLNQFSVRRSQRDSLLRMAVPVQR
jgi:hypothetical protein